MSTTDTTLQRQEQSQSQSPASSSLPRDGSGMPVIPPKKEDFKRIFGAAGLHITLTAIAFLLSLPLLWLVLTALKPLGEVGSDNWIPSTFQWINFKNVFDYDNPDINQRGIHFGRFYVNSLFVAAWVTFLQVLTSSMAAFSFSRLKWPGRDKVFLMYLSTMMLPGLAMMIPNYQNMIKFNLVDTLIGLILPGAFSAFGTFLLRQFMLSIPSSLDEAAEIDGANKWTLFWDIILPLARPGLITLTIFTFLGNYNSFFWPLVMLSSESRYTLPIGLMYFDSTRGQTTHLMMAAVTMAVAPMIILFIFLQKYLVKGIQLGAVKG